MASKTTFFVQGFEMKRSKLVPMEPAPTASGAAKRAEALASRVPGAAAICITADDETGELQAATILGTFGQVPDDFAESLLDCWCREERLELPTSSIHLRCSTG